jgi:tetraacyldisaccharide-1-P 4'-kinase
VLVVDGVLQTAPRRASLSLLALDAESPWGAGAVPPRGDLRSPVASLVSACDHVVVLETTSRGAHLSGSGRLLDWATLAPLRLGLFVALARPHRLRAALARRGITPTHVITLGDHAAPPLDLARRIAGSGCDLWLASPKCATRLEAAHVPHAIVEYEVRLPGSLRIALATLQEPSEDCPTAPHVVRHPP